MAKLQKKYFYKFLAEITVIVIGVLIAFQLTNWGKQIEKKETEREVVSQIYFELNDNLADLKNDVEIHRTALKSQRKVQYFLDC
ncbi:MAG: septal ring factor EnvC (AmiA/AmiB activator) [Arenicella sp.]|jgi:septal ring factor EnvC (AmiA/AmiB activator)